MNSPSESSNLLGKGVLAACLGVGLCFLVLALAGAPPFDGVAKKVQAQDAQSAAAPAAASTVTGAGGSPYWLPPNASEHGGEIDFLFVLITVVVGIAFVLVEACLIIFAWRYRHRPGRKATFIHGNHRLEIAWTVIPAVILTILVLISISTWGKIRYGSPPENATKIEVLGQQFQWDFKVLGTAERFGKVDDLLSQGLVHVPLGKPVSVTLRSRDVLHSFFLPNMRVKLDAVPGMTGHIWFTPKQVGSYEVVCAELCGAEHWKMKGMFHVDTPEDYEKWLDEVKVYTADKPK